MRNQKLLLKIERGTRSAAGIRLCDSCSRGHIMRGPAESEEIVYCHSLDKNITIHVVECSSYTDKTVPSLHDMKMIAWELRTDKSGKKIGFMSPSQLKTANQQREFEDDPDLGL